MEDEGKDHCCDPPSPLDSTTAVSSPHTVHLNVASTTHQHRCHLVSHAPPKPLSKNTRRFLYLTTSAILLRPRLTRAVCKGLVFRMHLRIVFLGPEDRPARLLREQKQRLFLLPNPGKPPEMPISLLYFSTLFPMMFSFSHSLSSVSSASIEPILSSIFASPIRGMEDRPSATPPRSEVVGIATAEAAAAHGGMMITTETFRATCPMFSRVGSPPPYSPRRPVHPEILAQGSGHTFSTLNPKP